MTAQRTLLFVALAAAFAATPTLARVASADAAEEQDGVPQERLVNEYADDLFNGDEVAAADAVASLREGGDFTITTTETRQATNPDGTLATNPDGTPKMETVTIETAIDNSNGPMGWGEVDHSLGMAQALVENGEAADFGEALMGAEVTTTDANGNTVTTYEGGILQMRADGMGWGQIAKELGFKSLGEIKSGRAFDETAAEADARVAKAERAAKVERAPKVERGGKPERVERVARVDRPEKPERPQRPERPERPVKPERAGRP